MVCWTAFMISSRLVYGKHMLNTALVGLNQYVHRHTESKHTHFLLCFVLSRAFWAAI